MFGPTEAAGASGDFAALFVPSVDERAQHRALGRREGFYADLKIVRRGRRAGALEQPGERNPEESRQLWHFLNLRGAFITLPFRNGLGRDVELFGDRFLGDLRMKTVAR